MNIEECQRLTKAVEKHGSAKELDFLTSIAAQYTQKGRLTPGQESWYNSLLEKFSEENLV